MRFVTLAELVEILKRDAPKLREAGVTKFSCADVTVELAAHEPSIDISTSFGDEEHTHIADPLQDPTTFGLPPGAKLPGFERTRDHDEADES